MVIAIVAAAVVILLRPAQASPPNRRAADPGKAPATARPSKALTQFNGQVQSLLTQSGPAYQQINQLFGQLQIAANGGTPSITLAQAEATISSVISNRTALEASAQTLAAPTPLAASVRGALVSAMQASLTDDQAISTCLNEANNGTVAYIFQSCLSSTAPDSQAATAAKQHFQMLDNQLRQSIGLPAATQPF